MNNGFSRFMGIFFEPVKTMQRLHEKSPWYEPFIVILITSIIFAYITFPIQVKDRVEMIKSSTKLSQRITEEQLEKIANPGEKSRIIQTLINSLIALIFPFLIFTGTLTIIIKMLGGEGSFKEFWCATLYSSYIDYFLGSGVKSALVMLKKTYLTVSTGISIFFPALTYKDPIYHVLTFIDFFTIWSYIVLSFGVSKFTKFSLKKSLIILGIIFLLRLAILSITTILSFKIYS
ncbi:MAG: YIP1 family protein [Acidobacteriota bacterium]